MSENISLANIKDFFDNIIEKHGATPLGVGWRSREYQFQMFDQFLYLLGSRAEPFSLNDIGCGYGALFEWAQERGLPLSRYTGYDISERMIEKARGLHAGPAARFERGTIPTEVADFSIASGIFNARFDKTDEAWADHMRATIRSLAESSRVGFGFNSLTTHVDWREPQLFYADPAEWFTWCKTNISKKVVLLDDAGTFYWSLIVKL